MRLSTDTLFHFSNLDATINILESKLFWPVYNLEIFSSEYYKEHKYGIPMVCFCDLDITLTDNHQIEYGSYAIGLKKTWAIGNNLNPVYYQLENSAFTSANESLIQLLQSMIPENHSNDELTDELKNTFLPTEISKNQIKSHAITYLIVKFLITIHAFKKPYKSKKFDKKEKIFLDAEVSYYDEREWRYIPEMYPNNIEEYEKLAQNPFHKPIINEQDYNENTLKEKYQQYINRYYCLRFEERDIDVIIVKSNVERNEIRNRLVNFYSNEFLQTKIRTYNEINS